MTDETEDVVKQALLVGDFKSAVHVCFENGHVGDALVLSSCGGAELWKETQAKYFQRERRPYLRIVEAVLGGDLAALIGGGTFEETMAVFSTYGKSEEFPRLCEKLGTHLKSLGDPAAILCYLCALNVPSAVEFWKAEYEAGQADPLALHKFIEKVMVFSQGEKVRPGRRNTILIFGCLASLRSPPRYRLLHRF